MLILDIYRDSECLAGGVPVVSRMTLGRAFANSVVVNDGSVSRLHVTIELWPTDGSEEVIFRDEGSTNGTFVNGKRIERQVVRPGDEIWVGSCRVQLRTAKGSLPPEVRDDAGSQTVIFSGNPFAGLGPSVNRLEALHELALLLPSLDHDHLLDAAARTVRDCIDFDAYCTVMSTRNGPVLRNAWNRDGACPTAQIEVSRTLIETCLESGEPIISEHIATDERFCRAGSTVINRISTAICAPLLGGGQTLGVLYCSSRAPGVSYSRDDLQFLVLVACDVAVATRHEQSLTRAAIEAGKLEAILESLQESVIVCDANFRILSVNSSAVNFFGPSSQVGKRLDRALSDTGCEHDFDPRTITVRSAFDIEKRIDEPLSYKQDGTVSLQATVSSVSGLEEGGWRHIVCVRDVTRIRRSQARQSQLTNQLAHKLRTPLTVITGANSWLGENVSDDIDAECRSMLDMAKHSSHEMCALIDRFVQFSEHSAPCGVGEHFEVVPLGDVFQRLVESTAVAVEHAKLQVIFDSSCSESQLAIDAPRLVLCFTQFVENAAKFAGGGATLTVGAELNDEQLTVSFTDNGPGIPPHEIESVFEMFYQIDIENTGEIPGVGLGLWWAREVVQQHGGDVRATSPAVGGRGVRFDIALPRDLVVDTDNIGRETQLVGGMGAADLDAERMRSC